MLYCEFCEISQKTFITEHLRATASLAGIILKKYWCKHSLTLCKYSTPIQSKIILSSFT